MYRPQHGAQSTWCLTLDRPAESAARAQFRALRCPGQGISPMRCITRGSCARGGGAAAPALALGGLCRGNTFGGDWRRQAALRMRLRNFLQLFLSRKPFLQHRERVSEQFAHQSRPKLLLCLQHSHLFPRAIAGISRHVRSNSQARDEFFGLKLGVYGLHLALQPPILGLRAE